MKRKSGVSVMATAALLFALLSACGSGGGGGGTSADTTPPTVTPAGPANSAANVAPDSAVSATFSEAVSGVDGTTFTLKDGADNSVAGAVVYSGMTATFTPSGPLACSTTYTATLTTGIADLASNPLATTSWLFTTRDVASWAYVDSTTVNGINKNATYYGTNPQLTVLGSKLYAAWGENNGTAYQIRVAVYNGNDSSPSWAFVDGNGANGINKDVTKNAASPQLTVFGNRLYATWRESNSTAYQIRVAVYNGNDSSPSWAFVDGNGANGINKDVTKYADDPQLTVLGSKLYATWAEDDGTGASQVRVAVYNGNDGSPSWAFVDGNGAKGINKDVTKNIYTSQLTVYSNRLYATWWEYSGTTYQIRVAVYNGNDGSPSWAFVDGNGANGINKDVNKNAQTPQLTVLASKLYATWMENNGTTAQIRVAVYNGNDGSPSWSFVDGNGTNGINKDVNKNAQTPQLTVLGSKLYATWTESNGTANQIRVAVYNGNDGSPSWVFVDGNGANGINKNTGKNASYPQLTIFDSKLYATWGEDNGTTYQIRAAVGQ